MSKTKEPSKQLIKEKTAAAMVAGLDPLRHFGVWKADMLANYASLVAHWNKREF
jgi:hypothetical protein